MEKNKNVAGGSGTKINGIALKRFGENFRKCHFHVIRAARKGYPLSLPHRNDEFYDYDRISSATFLMHSLIK